MIEVKGKYNTAKIFTDEVDEKSIKQVELLLDQKFSEGSKIRLMPDIHAGAGCTIGTTMTIIDKVVPNLVGVDIGCGMLCVKIEEKEVDLKKLDSIVYDLIPSGFNIRKEPHRYLSKCHIDDLRCIRQISYNRAQRSLGTLGGGNHFIEADRDEEGNIYLVIHSGSRHAGLQVAVYYQEEAYKTLNGTTNKEREALIKRLKDEGREKEIQIALKDFKRIVKTDIPKDLAYAEGSLLEDYLFDIKIMQEFADYNRKAMMDELINAMGFHVSEEFTTIHNYIDTEYGVLRKGAVSARKGEKLLIPINMRDGSLICIGKGNDDWNQSAPHGAGRLMSRIQAKKSFSVSEFEEVMSGIYSTSISKETIDECPMAYKKMEDIVKNIGDTADVLSVIKPIYNFKSGSE